VIISKFGDKTMTVGQLIAALQRAPTDLPVTTEGCDCNGEAFMVVLRDDDVYIRRYSRQIDAEDEDYDPAYLGEGKVL
jgi:hypothetical protein